MILLIVLYAIVALTFVFAKDAVLAAPPLFFVGVRMVCAGILLYAIQLFRNKKITLPKPTDIMLFFVITLLHIYIPFAGEFWALTKIDALKVNFLYALTPFFAVSLQTLIDKKLPKFQIMLGIMIGFCALVSLLIMNDQPSGLPLFARLFEITFPEIILLIAIISSTVAWFFINHMMKKKYSIDTINAWSMLCGGFFLLASSYCFETAVITNMYEFWKNLVLLILLSNVIFYNLYGMLLHRYSVTTITTAGFLSPLFGMLLQSVSLQTLPNPFYFVAFCFVLVGLFLMKE